MRRIPESKVKELQADGVKFFSDGKRTSTGISASTPPLQAKEPAPPQKTSTPSISAQAVLKAQADATLMLAKYGEALAQCVAELAKPKQKKAWRCSVSRSTNGQINNVDITES